MHRLPTPLCEWMSDGRRFQATNICRNVTHHTRPQSSETPLSEHQTCVFCEVRNQLVHFTDKDIASEGVKTDRRSGACSAQACTSFSDCTCLTRVGVVELWIPCVPRIPTAFREPYPTAAIELQPSAAPPSYKTHSSASLRHPSPFCMAAYTRDSYSTVLRGYTQSHLSAGTGTQTGPPRPSIRSPPHSTPQCRLLNSFAKSEEHVTEGCQVPRCSHCEKVCRCRRFGRTCCLYHQGCSVQIYTLYRPTHRGMHRHNTTPHWPLNCDKPR